MCVTCLAVSVLTLFSPVSDLPQAPNVAPSNSSVEQVRQVGSSPVAQDTQAAIASILKQLPRTTENQILHEEFKSLHNSLVGVTEDAAADAIIDQGLETLSERIQTAPNADKLTETLFKLKEDKYSPQVQLNFGAGRWGWLS